MSNNYFQFKQFKITQNHSALKVGTDGVLLGSWVDVENANNILDIGTGTGLIALMMAQKSEAHIDAIEIDSDACIDARYNFSQSIWENRLQVIEQDFLTFKFNQQKQYDVIVSNPPYFKNSLQSPNEQKNKARHSNSLPHDKLLDGVVKNLSLQGRFYVVIPSNISQEFVQIARLKGLHPSKCLEVYSKEHDIKSVRKLLCLSHQDCKGKIDRIYIYSENGNYSELYKQLTKEYYLAF